MADVRISIASESFRATLELERAPRTCEKFLTRLPLRARIIHARWSGEACWVPLGADDLGLGPENATSYPQPGQILLYPGGISETEILLPYGPVRFASKAGQLAGNHFLTVQAASDRLQALGKLVLWQGAQDVEFTVGNVRKRPVIPPPEGGLISESSVG